jgi:hypothetical protein
VRLLIVSPIRSRSVLSLTLFWFFLLVSYRRPVWDASIMLLKSFQNEEDWPPGWWPGKKVSKRPVMTQLVNRSLGFLFSRWLPNVRALLMCSGCGDRRRLWARRHRRSHARSQASLLFFASTLSITACLKRFTLGAHVLLTDQRLLLPALERNIAINRQQYPAIVAAAAELNWFELLACPCQLLPDLPGEIRQRDVSRASRPSLQPPAGRPSQERPIRFWAVRVFPRRLSTWCCVRTCCTGPSSPPRCCTPWPALAPRCSSATS